MHIAAPLNGAPAFVMNANETVYVRLTDLGILRLREQNRLDNFGNQRLQAKYKDPVPDEHGRVGLQLWALMRTFGPMLEHGGENFFEMDIVFPRKHMTDYTPTPSAPV